MVNFSDILFEISSEDRYNVLELLSEHPSNVTGVSKKLSLSLPETSRHLTRLVNVGLIEKNNESLYQLTPYGELILKQSKEISFTAQYIDFFNTHSTRGIPGIFLNTISKLDDSLFCNDVLEFLRVAEKVIKNANQRLFMIVDQFPINYLSIIKDAVDRNISFKIIESKERNIVTSLDTLSSDEILELGKTRSALHHEERMLDSVDVMLIVSERGCLFGLPLGNGSIDYRGFVSENQSSIGWCTSLFEHMWLNADPRKSSSSLKVLKTSHTKLNSDGIITLYGANDPTIDPIAIQRVVDEFEDIILSGSFNLGTSFINITKDVVLRGEGRENNIPLTKIKRQGWSFPFRTYDKLIYVNGKGINVTLENIHFTDFNNSCILAMEGNSLSILDNRLTLDTPQGRGMSWGKWGNQVMGIVSSGHHEHGSFDGGTIIRGNYLDFGVFYTNSGFYALNSREDDPNYRPAPDKLENYSSYGIIVNRKLGHVIVEENVVKNMNTRGIWVVDNFPSSDIEVSDNKVILNVYGSYSQNRKHAGYGISATSYWELPTPQGGNSVKLIGNEIVCDKVNYCGISVTGHARGREHVSGSIKYRDSKVIGNRIVLTDGAVGILIDRCDEINVENNQISGNSYLGIQVSGSKSEEHEDFSSNNNSILRNNMGELTLKEEDTYLRSLEYGHLFADSIGDLVVSHICLNSYTSNNRVSYRDDELVIDRGQGNLLSKTWK